MFQMRRGPLLLLIVVSLLPSACGEGKTPVRVEQHPAALAGRYAAGPDAFREEVVAAMRYELREVLEGEDQVAAEALQRHLDASSAAWSEALANRLELRPDGTLVWRLREPLAADPARGVRLVDLPAPSILAAYGGTWEQVAPSEIAVEFTTRNGRSLRWSSEGRCRVRPDGGLDIFWSRDVEMSIEEAPLLRLP